MITVQDDMVVKEKGWEKRLTYPLRKFDDVIAVSSRAAQDIKYIDEKKHIYINRATRESDSLSRDIFAVRDVINRGPVAFRMEHLRAINYLNEKYAPSDLDDADLCLRVWKERKLRSGAYWINYISRFEWGKTRTKDSTMYTENPIKKNSLQIKKDHGDYIKSGLKHSKDIFISESEIDYTGETERFKAIRYYPLADTIWGFKVSYQHIIRTNWHKLRKFIKDKIVTVLEKSGLVNQGDVESLGFKKIIKNKLKNKC